MARILVDMDGVLANWGARYDAGLDRAGANARNIPRTIDQRSFNLMDGRTDAEREIVRAVMAEPGFYADLDPIDGAIAAVEELAKHHDVWICTSPLPGNPTCAQDKLDWVATYLGIEWLHRVILTHDKASVRADILIDDRPDIPGAADATWKQVLFDQPYNRAVTDLGARIWSWLETGLWREAIAEALAEPEPLAEWERELLDIGKGEVRKVSPTGGEKGAKPQRYDLIPVVPMDLLAELYSNGAAKYAAHNWRRGYAWSLSYAAAMRHLTRFWNGEDIDPEMALPHVTAAAFHVFALAQFMVDFPEYDDRFKPAESAA